MSSGTIQRIVSGLVLAGSVFACLYFGKYSTLGLIFLFGLLSIDEIETNFVGRKRGSIHYILSQVLYVGSYAFFGFYKLGVASDLIIYLAIVQNIILIAYLFLLPMESTKAVKALTKVPLLSGLFITIPFIALTYLFSLEEWVAVVLLVAFINFGMDTFAWFWGKLMGKTKLWEAVSPKKTVEGFIGGAISAMFLGQLIVYIFKGQAVWSWAPIFFFLACFSQVGDLIQSKLKRQMGIKDSSSLIPGHGGVYDRIDSMVFMAPLMAILIKLFYL